MENNNEFLVIYIRQQEPWWGNYNPNLLNGDDEYGNGTYEFPFKTVERALKEFEIRKCKRGLVRDGSELIAIYPSEEKPLLVQIEHGEIEKELNLPEFPKTLTIQTPHMLFFETYSI